MKPEQWWADIKRQNLGRSVRDKRLVANSLLIYIDSEPGDKSGYVFWLEPTWHYCGHERVIAGSRQAQTDDEEEFHQIADALLGIVGLTLVEMEIEARTFDLKVTFEDGSYVKTFVADPNDEEQWHITDNATEHQLYGSPRGLGIHERRLKPGP